MARYKKYIDANVLDEAKKRIHHIYDIHDSVVVAFSGGKDSLATLNLTWEVAQERGITTVHAVFRDEELINQEVLDFVREWQQKPWLDLKWWAVPLQSHKFVLGKSTDYVQWDPNRPWIREKPEWALTEKDLGIPEGEALSQYTADEVMASGFVGKVCIITGLRADESLMRLRSCVNKLNENYIVASSTPRATLGRPIFDWAENDVFKYFYDRDIQYCSIYDSQTWAGHSLRVATPIHAEAAKKIGKLREVDPDLYARVIEIFPDMTLQDRYYKELDQDAIKRQYATSWDGIKSWIDENFDEGHMHDKAIKEFYAVRIRAKASPDSYPLDYVLKCFMTQGGKRTILPK